MGTRATRRAKTTSPHTHTHSLTHSLSHLSHTSLTSLSLSLSLSFPPSARAMAVVSACRAYRLGCRLNTFQVCCSGACMRISITCGSTRAVRPLPSPSQTFPEVSRHRLQTQRSSTCCSESQGDPPPFPFPLTQWRLCTLRARARSPTHRAHCCPWLVCSFLACLSLSHFPLVTSCHLAASRTSMAAFCAASLLRLSRRCFFQTRLCCGVARPFPPSSWCSRAHSMSQV